MKTSVVEAKKMKLAESKHLIKESHFDSYAEKLQCYDTWKGMQLDANAVYETQTEKRNRENTN